MRRHADRCLRENKEFTALIGRQGSLQWEKPLRTDAGEEEVKGFDPVKDPDSLHELRAADNDGGFKRARAHETAAEKRALVRKENEALFAKSYGAGAWRCRACGKCHKATVEECDGFLRVGSKKKACAGTLKTTFGGYLIAPPIGKEDDGTSPWNLSLIHI